MANKTVRDVGMEMAQMLEAGSKALRMQIAHMDCEGYNFYDHGCDAAVLRLFSDIAHDAMEVFCNEQKRKQPEENVYNWHSLWHDLNNISTWEGLDDY